VDGAGNLYGTTQQGGDPTYSAGTVFRLSKKRQTWVETVLHTFCQAGPPCADGASPTSTLTIDVVGQLFGTAAVGTGGGGVVFQLSPNGASSAYTPLYNFGSAPEDGTDLTAGVIIGGNHVLYGTTRFGGSYGHGQVFKLTGTSLKIVHRFCRDSGCEDGDTPSGGLFLDAAGQLYGMTAGGGTSNNGVVYGLQN
jgi:uncharacterized repeat protein (TIGR03803 family)